VPVILLGDEGVGHLREPVDVPPETRVYRRAMGSEGKPSPFGGQPVPAMPAFGDGARLMVTGSTHDPMGYRRTASAEVQSALVERLASKISDHRDEIIRTEALLCGDSALDVLIVTYGFTARSAHRAARQLRAEGQAVGLLRLETLWPFPSEAVAEMAARARRVLVPEMNRGQMLREVQRLVPEARGYGKTDGEVITPADIVRCIGEWTP